MRSLFIQLFIPTICLVAIFLIEPLLNPQTLIHEKIWNLFSVFFLLSFFTSFITNNALGKNKSNLLIYYLLATIVRIFVSLIVLLLYISLGVSDRNIFVGNFFLIYFFYMVFEIYFLLTNLQANSK